jgi:hypothetical protein
MKDCAFHRYQGAHVIGRECDEPSFALLLMVVPVTSELTDTTLWLI